VRDETAKILDRVTLESGSVEMIEAETAQI